MVSIPFLIIGLFVFVIGVLFTVFAFMVANRVKPLGSPTWNASAIAFLVIGIIIAIIGIGVIIYSFYE